MKEIKSTMLSGAHYDPTTKVLRVKFATGKAYEYSGVPQKTYNEFEATFQEKTSSGKHFNRHIRKFPCKPCKA